MDKSITKALGVAIIIGISVIAVISISLFIPNFNSIEAGPDGVKVEVGSPEDKSDGSVSVELFSITPEVPLLGEKFAVSYKISNPNDSEVFYLGISIRPNGVSYQIIDTTNDVAVTVLPGVKNYERLFDLNETKIRDLNGNVIPIENIQPGVYDIALALWSGSPESDSSFQVAHTGWIENRFIINE